MGRITIPEKKYKTAAWLVSNCATGLFDWNICFIMHCSRPENLKMSRPIKVKLVKSNKSISRKYFWLKSNFCTFKNDQKTKINFWTGKMFKTLYSMKKIFFVILIYIYLISRVFFFCPGLFKFPSPLYHVNNVFV